MAERDERMGSLADQGGYGFPSDEGEPRVVLAGGVPPFKPPVPSGMNMLQDVLRRTTNKGIVDALPPPPRTHSERIAARTKGMSDSDVLNSDELWATSRDLMTHRPLSFSQAYSQLAERRLGRPLTADEISKAMVEGAAADVISPRKLYGAAGVGGAMGGVAALAPDEARAQEAPPRRPRDDWTMSLLADQGAYRGDYPDWQRRSHEAEGPPAPRSLPDAGGAQLGAIGNTMQRLAPHLVDAFHRSFRGPQELAAENPYKPGTEEWQQIERWKQDRSATFAGDWAMNLLGLNRLGGGVRGGVGVGGGRIVQPQPTMKAPGEEAAGALATKAPGSLFDYSKIHEVPDVRQFDLPRYDPPRGVSQRVQDLVANEKVRQQMLDYFERGKKINADTFYYNEPLREAFIAELGKKQGPTDFRRYMEYVGGSSPRSTVEENARNASYYYMLEKQGLPVPPQGGVNPQPYGHLAQNLHRLNAEQIRTGEWDVLNKPKPPSFVENLTGNFAPGTIDAHAFKLPAMLAQDPRFLAGSMNLDKGVTVNPAEMFKRGELTMEEALKRPAFWAGQPNKNEYAAMERYYKQLAREADLATAQGQAAGWGGGGEVTGLGSIAGDPFMHSVENRAIKTAAERGITPAEALSRMMRGRQGLLGLSGAVGMGALASQGDYRQ